jgi:cellulose synthase/poly-beta-1,6-N-acetylglucosamine synthase-like glycosyltransferase
MYQVLLITAIVLTILYSLLIILYRRWFLELPRFEAPSDQIPKTRFSIIIPARNEADNIDRFLPSILNQQYPAELFDVTVINDHSTDETAQRVQFLQKKYAHLFLIELSEHVEQGVTNAYKKKAIEIAIAQSKGSWILTTDADCMANPEWLLQYDAYIQKHQPVLVAAPVMFFNTGSFLSLFQVLDFISLQGITAAAVSAGSHAMCNGANLAYLKTAFYEVGQFRGIDHIASGDDMLLMQKIKQRFPGKLGYLFQEKAIIQTEAMPTWKSFLNQRIRWASKADSFQDKRIFMVLLLVYLFNFSLLLLAIFALFGEHGGYRLLILVATKTIVELSFMIPVSRFFGLTKTLGWFPIMQPFHILYTVIAGWLGKFGSYQWKGRKLQ